MREIVHIQAGQCGNQIGSKVKYIIEIYFGDYTSAVIKGKIVTFF